MRVDFKKLVLKVFKWVSSIFMLIIFVQGVLYLHAADTIKRTLPHTLADLYKARVTINGILELQPGELTVFTKEYVTQFDVPLTAAKAVYPHAPASGEKVATDQTVLHVDDHVNIWLKATDYGLIAGHAQKPSELYGYGMELDDGQVLSDPLIILAQKPYIAVRQMGRIYMAMSAFYFILYFAYFYRERSKIKSSALRG